MTVVARTLLLFGATGDLAQRMLLPSLFALHADRLIAEDLRIIGTARGKLGDEGFRDAPSGVIRRSSPPSSTG